MEDFSERTFLPGGKVTEEDEIDLCSIPEEPAILPLYPLWYIPYLKPLRLYPLDQIPFTLMDWGFKVFDYLDILTDFNFAYASMSIVPTLIAVGLYAFATLGFMVDIGHWVLECRGRRYVRGHWGRISGIKSVVSILCEDIPQVILLILVHERTDSPFSFACFQEVGTMQLSLATWKAWVLRNSFELQVCGTAAGIYAKLTIGLAKLIGPKAALILASPIWLPCLTAAVLAVIAGVCVFIYVVVERVWGSISLSPLFWTVMFATCVHMQGWRVADVFFYSGLLSVYMCATMMSIGMDFAASTHS